MATLDARFIDDVSVAHSDVNEAQGGADGLHLTSDEYTKLLYYLSNKDRLIDKVNKLSYGVYVAFGAHTLKWGLAESDDTDQSVLRKLTLPEPSIPIRCTVTQGSNTFLVLLKNGVTYAYSRGAGLYILSNTTPISNISIPERFELGHWFDVAMTYYWAKRSDSSRALYVLTDTSVHLGLIHDDAITTSGHLKWAAYSGDYGVQMRGENDKWCNVTTLVSGSAIRYLRLYSNSVSPRYTFAYIGNSFCIVKSANITNSSTVSYSPSIAFEKNISFPYGTIKKVWIPNALYAYVQNTSNIIYRCAITVTTGDLTWTALGAWNTKKITRFFMLTNNKKLYYTGNANTSYGLPASVDMYNQIFSDFAFDDICDDGSYTYFMGIGKKLA